jgi:two-component system, chemotaxis family, CheB/CheR fusion protein
MAEDSDPSFEALLDYLQRNRGFDFTGYKHSTLMRRVKKRMQDVSVSNFTEYVDFLEVHPEEFPQLFNTILINVTAFYRDPESWNYLATEVVPKIIASKPAEDSIRVWSAGCASGEEPYTLALILCEALGAEAFRRRLKIYATDVDEEALNQARQASYDAHAMEAVPADLRERYFQPNGNRCVFNPDLRRCVIFGRHDIVQDAPISRLDLLVCRNTLMYLNAETQARVLARFHFALAETGFLFLGRAELLLTHGNLFRPVDMRHRIFAKVLGAEERNGRLLMPEPHPSDEGRRAAPTGLSEAAFDSGPWPRLVVDQNGTLVLVNHQARARFGLRSTDLGRPFHELPISYRPLELRSLIERVTAGRSTVTVPSVEHSAPGNGAQIFEVQIAPLLDTIGRALGVSVTFLDITRFTRLQEELQTTRSRLETAQEELQSTNEELETTNEELQSTVEELETTNEELQSSNEELETMNEELQSTNEELQTLNDELRLRTDDLNDVNTFLESILSGLRAAVVVLDDNMAVHVWNRKAEDLWGLRDADVQQRPFFSLDIGAPMEPLRGLVQKCLEQRSAQPEVMLPATNRRGKAFQCRVTATPRIGTDNRRLGVILLMEEEAAAAP